MTSMATPTNPVLCKNCQRLYPRLPLLPWVCNDGAVPQVSLDLAAGVLVGAFDWTDQSNHVLKSVVSELRAHEHTLCRAALTYLERRNASLP